MTEYHAPLKDMRFALRELAGLDGVLELPAYETIDGDTVDQVLEGAGNFARDILAPLNIPGDRAGVSVVDRQKMLQISQFSKFSRRIWEICV